MHQNAIGGRALPGPAGGAYSAPIPLAGFKGRKRKEKDRERGEGKGKGKREGEGRGERRKGRELREMERDIAPRKKIMAPPPQGSACQSFELHIFLLDD